MTDFNVVVEESQTHVFVEDSGDAVVVTESFDVVLIDPGLVGPEGPIGPAGPPGSGENGVLRFFHGDGPPPEVIPGAAIGDVYIDDVTGTIYQLT